MFVKLKLLILIFNLFQSSSPQTMRASGAFVLGYFDTPTGQGNAVMRKTYYLTSIFMTTWIEAYNFCAASTMSLATFDSQTQLNQFLTMMQANAAQFTLCNGLFIGAVANAQPVTATSWAWVQTGVSVNQTLPWYSGYPVKNGNCLAILLSGGTTTIINTDCYSVLCSFACTDTKVIVPNTTWTSTSMNIINQAKSKQLTTLAKTTTIASG